MNLEPSRQIQFVDAAGMAETLGASSWEIKRALKALNIEPDAFLSHPDYYRPIWMRSRFLDEFYPLIRAHLKSRKAQTH